MPTAAPIAMSAAGLGLNLFDRIKGPSAAEQQRSNAVSQGEQAQAAEIQRQTALNKKMEDILFQIYGNADQAWKPGMEGSSGPQSQDAFANLVRSKALDRIMGLTGSPGSGLLGLASQQGYLEDAQGHQDLVGSAEALADSVLAWGESRKAPEVIDPVGVPGLQQGSGYADSLGQGTTYIDKF